VRLGGSDRNWSFFSTGFDALLSYVVGAGAMLGATADTDLALDPAFTPAPTVQVPTLIARKAALAWPTWWEASVLAYERTSRGQNEPRSLGTCEALAGNHLSLMLNRVRPSLTAWLRQLDPTDVLQHSASQLVTAAEEAHGKRARDFTVRYDLLPVSGPIVLVAFADPAEARSRLLISSAEARTPGHLDRILAEALDRVAF